MNSSVSYSDAKLCPTLCEPMGCSTPGSHVLHYLPRFAQTHVCCWWCCLYSIGLSFHHQSHPQLSILSPWPSLLILSGVIRTYPPLFPGSILDTFRPGGLIFLLQLTRFCHNSSLRPLCLGWPCTAWLPASLIYASPSPRGCDPQRGNSSLVKVTNIMWFLKLPGGDDTYLWIL